MSEIFGFIMVMLVVWILVSVFVTGHAADNGKTRWWGVAVFFFGVFALVAYAISLASD